MGVAAVVSSGRTLRDVIATGESLLMPGWTFERVYASFDIERKTVDAAAAENTGRPIAGHEGQDTQAALATIFFHAINHDRVRPAPGCHCQGHRAGAFAGKERA